MNIGFKNNSCAGGDFIGEQKQDFFGGLYKKQ